MFAIEVDNLQKKYDGKIAVDGISFTVNEGEVFGLLGPNGAGKTTTVEILESLRKSDGGTIKVLGHDIGRETLAVKQQIGVALQTTTMMQNLTCLELLELFASFFPKPVAPKPLLERMGLTEKANEQVQKLSGGQQQRLSVALALINEPKLVFLDEPTTGLDPQARRSLWGVIEEMKKEGRTVFLTTHYMDEAEQLCDRIAIMDHGKILSMDSPKGLIQTNFREKAVQFAAPEGVKAERFADIPHVIRTAEEGGDIVLYSTNAAKTLGALFERVEEQGLNIEDAHVRRATLEDVFLKLTGRSMRD